MEGHLQKVGREGEGRVMVKYSSAPLPYDFEYSILDTDYDSYAVMWSCSGIGPVHTRKFYPILKLCIKLNSEHLMFVWKLWEFLFQFQKLQ